MNKNAEKIFDMLGLKPGDKFKIEEVGSFSSLSTKTFCICENLTIMVRNDCEEDFDNANGFLAGLLNGQYKITRIIEMHKKKIIDLSEDEMDSICNINLCNKCPLKLGACIVEFLKVNPSAFKFRRT